MSTPENASKLKNYIKLQMLIKQTSVVLRTIFCDRWQQTKQQKWEDVPDRKFELVNGFGRELFMKAGKLQKEKFKMGDINEFDVTTLCQMIQLMNNTGADKGMLQAIVEVRNKLAHHPTQEVDTGEYDALWQKLSKALIHFGYPNSELKELYATESIAGINLTKSKAASLENISAAHRLKEEANEAFRNQNYAKSIDLYSEAIDLRDLSEDVLGILYSNRSSSYLKLSDKKDDIIRKARSDAKQAINCRPSWWKSYSRLGSVYEAQRKYDKAIIAYNKALCLDPTQSLVRSARDGCLGQIAIMRRKEHLDPQNMPMSLDEQIAKTTKRTGTCHISSSDDIEKMMRMARKSGDPFLVASADHYLAHKYLTGMEDVPQNYEKAAQLFAKAATAGNADALYNLALLTKNGHGVQRDITEAIRLLLQAAALPPKTDGSINTGVAEAQHSLGLCYEDGVGVDPNPTKAREWYEKSFENGCSSAAHNLGWMYAESRGVKGSIERAVQYWESSATSGNVLAMDTLEQHYATTMNFQRAKYWWQCALKNGSLTASQRADIYAKLDELPPFEPEKKEWQEFKSCIDELTLIRYSNHKQIGATSGFSHRPKFPELIRKADEGSITAANLLMAYHHFFRGLQLFETKFFSNDDVAKKHMIHEFAEAYRIEYIVPRWEEEIVEHLKPYIELKLKAVVTQPPSNFESDLRVCYTYFRFHSKDEMLEFNNVSIQRFPHEPLFYDIQQCLLGFLNRYGDGLRNASQALEQFPRCVPILYNKAVHSRLSDTEPSKCIKAYENFIAVAPNDHRKIPECYYAMATLSLKDIAQCQRYYDLGLKKETQQLSCFLPYDSSSKTCVANMLRMTSKMDGSNRKLKSVAKKSKPIPADCVNPKKIVNLPVKQSTPNPIQLSDPYRVLLTVAHRERYTALKGTNIIAVNTVKGHKLQESPANLVGLKAITFREMDPTVDHVYEGFVLQVWSIEDASVGGSSVAVILIDENCNFQRCYVYNTTGTYSSDDIQSKFGFGASFSILNPYMRMAADGKPGIRIDDPRSIVHSSSAEDRSKKCRYCFANNDYLKTCARCKRVWYCSKECQISDWKLLKHKLLCACP